MSAARKTIETERLTLEPLERRHAALMFDALRDERIYRFIPHVAVTTLDALEERFERLSQGRSPSGAEAWLNWALLLRDGSGYAGYVQATVRGRDRRAEIGYALVPAAWGFGLASEAVLAMIAELQTSHEVTVFGANVDTRNHRSSRLLEKLGFVRMRERAGDLEYVMTLARKPPLS